MIDVTILGHGVAYGRKEREPYASLGHEAIIDALEFLKVDGRPVRIDRAVFGYLVAYLAPDAAHDIVHTVAERRKCRHVRRRSRPAERARGLGQEHALPGTCGGKRGAHARRTATRDEHIRLVGHRNGFRTDLT